MTEAAPLLLLKVSVLLAAALFAARALRRAPAARRHAIWSAAFVALLALPLLALVLPALRVPVPSMVLPNAPPKADRVDAIETPELPIANGPRSNVELSSAPASGVESAQIDLPSPTALLTGSWLAGAAAALVALLIALARVGRMTAGARALDSAEWRDTVRQVSELMGVRRGVRVLAAEAVITPLAGGIIRPTVYVPLDAAKWDAERRQIVLAHEIAHLASRDPLRKLVSRVACTLYWFHPLVWLAQRQATTDCEQACDETVLALGVRPSTYARVLLDFADAAPLRVAGAMVPIVRRAHLEERLMAILHPSPRPAAARRGAFLLVAMGALTLTLAATRPVSPVVPAEATEAMRTPEPPRAIGESRARVARAVDSTPSAAVVLAAEPCWDSASDDRSFSGSISMSGTTIHEQIGRRGGERVIRTRLGDLRLCMITEGFGNDREAPPSEWIARADRVILETQRGNEVRQMVIAGNDVTWTVDGQARPMDAAASEWRAALLAVLDPIWELAQLRGTASTMRGEISTIHGERSTLRGEISTLRGHVSTLRGEISTLRGHVSTLRGEISTIRGHESTLRGRISTERGAISSLRTLRDAPDDVAARIRRHEDEIRRIEAEIARYDADARVRAVERELGDFNVEARVAELEQQIRDFDLAGRTAAIERQIADLDVERRVQAIENDIQALDVPGRSRELEQRRDAALARLRDVLR